MSRVACVVYRLAVRGMGAGAASREVCGFTWLTSPKASSPQRPGRSSPSHAYIRPLTGMSLDATLPSCSHTCPSHMVR